MTRLVLTGMTERRKGVIINLASSAGTSPVPLLTVYSATKVLVLSSLFGFGSACVHFLVLTTLDKERLRSINGYENIYHIFLKYGMYIIRGQNTSCW